jgi:hypothetical protein
MVALTTAADICTEARIGGVTHSVTMTTITNRIRPTTAPAVSTITAVQQKLAQLGYYHGQVDSIAGPETHLSGCCVSGSLTAARRGVRSRSRR